MNQDLDQLIFDLQEHVCLSPHDINAYFMLAQLYDLKKENEKAQACYAHILTVDPTQARAHFELAVHAQLTHDDVSALTHYEAVSEQSEYFIPSLSNRVLIYFQQQNYHAACQCAEKLVVLTPNDTKVWNDLGVIYKKLQYFEEAEAAFLKVLQLDSEHAQALGNLASIYRHQRQLYLAFEYAKLGLSRLPEQATRERIQQLNNLALICNDMGQFEIALTCCSEALKLDSTHHISHWNHSISLLLNQKWQEGFQEYVWGLTPVKERVDLSILWDKPEWHPNIIASSVQGIAIYTEQGFGDTILFVRYLSYVLALNIPVILVVQPELIRLCQSSFPSVICISPSVLYQYEEKITHQVCLLKLPALFHAESGIRIRQYLHVPKIHLFPELTRLLEIAKHGGQLCVGFVWSGNPQHPRDQDRSFEFDTFLPLIQAFFGKVTFFGMQKGEAQKQYIPHRHALKHFHDVGSMLTDFTVTAAFMKELDLVLSIDTAPAHLAGALGIPTWVLPPVYYPEWRWLCENNTNSSLWYGEKVVVHKYPNYGDIRGCLAHLIEDLAYLLEEKI